MKRFVLPILAMFLIVPASLHAQIGYGYPNQGYGGSSYGGYYPNVNSYGPAPPRYSPGLGLLNPTGAGGTAIRYATTVNNTQNLRYQQSQFDRVFQNPGLGTPPVGAIEGDLYARIPEAGHYSGFNNTLGYYPLNGRTTTTAGQKPATPQQPKRTGQ